MKPELVSVNVEEGFYPRFAEAFREHYGPESVFVRAVADSFTLALSRVLDARGVLAKDTVVPILGPEGASRAVGQLLRGAPSVRNTLLQEAFGAAPIGSFCAKLDNLVGAAIFARWLALLEAGDYDAASELVPGEQEPGNA